MLSNEISLLGLENKMKIPVVSRRIVTVKREQCTHQFEDLVCYRQCLYWNWKTGKMTGVESNLRYIWFGYCSNKYIVIHTFVDCQCAFCFLKKNLHIVGIFTTVIVSSLLISMPIYPSILYLASFVTMVSVVNFLVVLLSMLLSSWSYPFLVSSWAI